MIIIDPNHKYVFYKRVLYFVMIIFIAIIIFYFLNRLTYAEFLIESINIGDPLLKPDIGVDTTIPLKNTLRRWNNKGNIITNNDGIVSIRTGSVPTAWKITANINIVNPNSDVTISLFDQTKKTKFGTLVNIKAIVPFGGTACIQDYIQLPPNTVFIFSLQGTATPPAFIGKRSSNVLKIQQVRLDGF